MNQVIRISAQVSSTDLVHRRIRFKVDERLFHSILPRETCRLLGLNFSFTDRVSLGGESEVLPVGLAHLRIGTREGPILVACADVPEPILGFSALEALGLKVDRLTNTIVRTPHYPPRAFHTAAA